MNLDDQLKQAQVDKTNAEAQKLLKEADAIHAQFKSDFWSEAIKIVGAVILGIGGAVAAYTQFEVSELKAKIAQDELSRAQVAQAEADQKKKAAEEDAMAAIAKRDLAQREQKDAEAAVAELKITLAQTNSQLAAVKPSDVKARLTYIQFRGEITRDLINELRDNLKGKAFTAPGAERVAGEYDNLVKYFKPEQSADAENLAKAVEEFFSDKACPLKFRIIPAASASTSSNPPLEVWLSSKCTR